MDQKVCNKSFEGPVNNLNSTRSQLGADRLEVDGEPQVVKNRVSRKMRLVKKEQQQQRQLSYVSEDMVKT